MMAEEISDDVWWWRAEVIGGGLVYESIPLLDRFNVGRKNGQRPLIVITGTPKLVIKDYLSAIEITFTLTKLTIITGFSRNYRFQSHIELDAREKLAIGKGRRSLHFIVGYRGEKKRGT